MAARPALHVTLPDTIAMLSPDELRALPARALAAEARLARVSNHVIAAADEPLLPELSWDEVAEHTTREDCWVAIEGVVYDLSGVLATHPGGESAVLDAAAGGDATALYRAIHDPAVLARWGGTLVPKVGRVTGASPPLLTGRAPWGGWQPAPAAVADADEPLDSARVAQAIADNPHLNLQPALPVQLESPFPHGQFEHQGLEAVRFQWAGENQLRCTSIEK